MSVYLIPLAVPGLLAIAALACFCRPGIRPGWVLNLASAAGLGAVAASLASLAVLLEAGSGQSPTIGLGGFGFSAWLDPVSATMLLLVSFVGWIVIRYSVTYLDGEGRQGLFVGNICATLASILLLVQSGNLVQFLAAWVASSLFLHRLLLFYPERPIARRAAAKKFLTARISDIAIVAAFGLLYWHAGTADMHAILGHASSMGDAWQVTLAASLIAVAALLKSAQFPTHGWLTEVMETPTPVSALLHAGVINAGGFLLIRFADVMIAAPGVLAILVLVGGFTAIFGSLVMLTQSAVKTSLAWSTVAQMGFMIMQCGLSLFPIALLHIVAHSLYKAHSFLGSGNAVKLVQANRKPGPVAIPAAKAVAYAFLVALAMYGLIGAVFGITEKSPQEVALGAILIFGVAYLFAQGFADAAPKALTLRTTLYAALASVSYFTLQLIAKVLTADALPRPLPPGPLEWALMVLAIVSFGLVAVAQAMFPLWANHPAAAGLRVHLQNGLYINTLLDLPMRAWLKQKHV